MHHDKTPCGAEEGRELLAWWIALTGLCIASWLAGGITYELLWHYLLPGGVNIYSTYPVPGPQLFWLTCAMVLYAGLGWSRLGGWFVAAHVLALMLLATLYLDHIAQTRWSPYASALWLALPPPVCSALATAAVMALGWAWWFRRRTVPVRFGLRSLVAATAITALILAGLSNLK